MTYEDGYARAEEIRERYSQGDCTQDELAEMYDTTNSTISRIVNHQVFADPPGESPEADTSDLTPCVQCQMLCEGELCSACIEELRRGTFYPDTPEYLREMFDG